MKITTAVFLNLIIASGILHAQKTDSGTYAEPALPTLPTAGGTFRDPLFGSLIMRVTDKVTLGGASCRNAYSYWPTFNSTNTRIYVLCDGGYAMIVPFDPVAFQLAGKPFILDTPNPNSQLIYIEDAIWSNTNPDVIFFHSDDTVYAYNVVLKYYTEVVSFRTQLSHEYIRQMSVTTDNKAFAFHLVTDGGGVVGYVVWNANTNSLLKVPTTDVNEVRIDKTGQFLIILPKNTEQHYIMRIVDLLNGTTTTIVDGPDDYAPGHLDVGRGSVFGHDRWNNQTTFRWLVTPHSFVGVHPMYSQWDVSSHLSMLADDEGWGLKSTYAGGAHTPGPFRDEIFQVATDGSQQVRRWAHHRSIFVGYWDTPRANISRDGKFIAFTSNWGNSGRQDLFVINTKPDAGVLQVSPTSATVAVRSQVAFIANQPVTWVLNGAGTLSSNGVYTAPAGVGNSSQVTITGTSVADVSRHINVTVTLVRR